MINWTWQHDMALVTSGFENKLTFKRMFLSGIYECNVFQQLKVFYLFFFLL